MAKLTALVTCALLALLPGCYAAASNHRLPTTLKAAASPRYFGAALATGHLLNKTDPLFAKFGAAEFSAASPENEMKWEIVEPFQNQFNFSEANVIAKFAKKHKQKLRCHNLVWHSQLAPFVSQLPLNQVKDVMLNHIDKVAGHFKDDCYAWDVVNEPFNDDGTFRDSPFFNAMGEDFIAIALARTRRVAPKVKLYINDFNIEGQNPKSDAMFNLYKTLKRQKLIDGIGFESHFIVDGLPPDMRQNMQRFANLGVDVAVTELDLRARTPFNATIKQAQADNYATIINHCQAISRCVGVTIWGITDRYSWIPGFFTGQGEALPFDENYGKKQSYFSTLQAWINKAT